MTITIDMDNVLDLLAKAVETRGKDFNYSTAAGAVCVYVDEDGAPSCLIGVALALAGADLTCLRSNFTRNTQGITSLANSFGDKLNVEVTVGAKDVLAAAQRVQDGGSTWGRAYQVAVERHTDLARRESL